MTGAAWAILGLTALIAIADWVAVARSLQTIEYAAKPAVMIALFALALVLQPVSGLERILFLFALGLGLLSDVFLMLPTDMFLLGLVAALFEHIAYIAGFRARDFHVTLMVAALVVAVVSVVVVMPPIYRALRKTQPALVGPVIGYVAVFVVMVVSAGGTGSGIALAGALLFFYSDALLAHNRFVKPVGWGRLVNIIAYHSGQALLVVSLAY